MTSRTFIHLKKGATITAGGRTYRVTHYVKPDAVLAQDVDTGNTEEIHVDAIRPQAPAPEDRVGDDPRAAPTPDVTEYSEQAWSEAERRFEAIKSLIGTQRRRRADIEQAAAAAGVNAATIYRWLNAYLDAECISALIPNKPGPAQGGRKLSPQVETIIQSCIRDIYLRKYGSDGEVLWTKQFGSTDLDSDAHVTVNAGGGIFVASRATGPFAADHGQPEGDPDVAVTRFGPDGGMVWSTLVGALGDPSAFGNDDDPSGLAIDPATGQVVVAGNTDGDLANADIDGGAETVTDGEGSPDHAGSGAAFLLRLDPQTGDLLRSRQFDINARDRLGEVAVGPDGTATTVGNLDALGNALPGQPPIPTSGGGAIFTVTHDDNGDRTWTRQDTPLTGDAGPAGVAVDSGGIQYIAGNDVPAVLVTDAQGRLLTEIADEIFSESDTGFGSGETSAIVERDGSLYLAGNSNTSWAGPALGEETDGWVAKLDITASEATDADGSGLPKQTAIQGSLFLKQGGMVNVSNPLEVFGRSGGNEVVLIEPSTGSVELDANVERVDLPDPLSSYAFGITDAGLVVSADNAMVFALPSANQTMTLRFADGSASLAQTGAQRFQLGDAVIAGTQVEPEVDLDDTETSLTAVAPTGHASILGVDELG